MWFQLNKRRLQRLKFIQKFVDWIHRKKEDTIICGDALSQRYF